jgi:hypothetical protein
MHQRPNPIRFFFQREMARVEKMELCAGNISFQEFSTLHRKDSRRFAKTNGWGFFNFGHHVMPYAASAAEAPVSECAGCHMSNVAKADMTWVQFYPPAPRQMRM